MSKGIAKFKDNTFQAWGRLTSVPRAMRAWRVFEITNWLPGRTTALANLLVEAYLRDNGLRYERGIGVNGVTPAFLVHVEKGLIAWFVYPDRATATAGAVDEQRAVGKTYKESQIVGTTHVVAEDVYRDDTPIEMARKAAWNG